MSDSAPSDSSTDVVANEGVTAEFIPNFGVDLVEITRSDQPIFLAPELRWGSAGHDEALYGAPLDRVYGEEPNTYITGMLDAEDVVAAILAGGPLVNDPMVTLPGLSDGLILALPEDAPLHAGAVDEGHALLNADTLHTAELNTVFDFGPDAHANVAHLHETWTWDLDKGAWVFDHHA
jgi:hypothetical protein